MTQSRTAKTERGASPKYTDSKRTAAKSSVTRRNSRKSERGEANATHTAIRSRYFELSMSLYYVHYVSKGVVKLMEAMRYLGMSALFLIYTSAHNIFDKQMHERLKKKKPM